MSSMGYKGDAMHHSQHGSVQTLGRSYSDAPPFMGRKMPTQPNHGLVIPATAHFVLEKREGKSKLSNAEAARMNQVPRFGVAAMLQGNEASILNFNGITNQSAITRSNTTKQVVERQVGGHKRGNGPGVNSRRYHQYNALAGKEWGNV